MLRIVYGSQDRLRLLLCPTLISGLFRPVLHNSPICSESRVLPGFLCKRRSKTSNVQQFGEVVYVIPCCLFRREFVLYRLSGDARLQGTLDGITRNVVGAGRIARPRSGRRHRPVSRRPSSEIRVDSSLVPGYRGHRSVRQRGEGINTGVRRALEFPRGLPSRLAFGNP